MDLYIYYRVQERHAPALQKSVTAMQAGLLREQHVTGTLKRKQHAVEGQQTWMEVYLAVPDNFDDTLRHAVARAELAGLIEGARHAEYFLDFAPCV